MAANLGFILILNLAYPCWKIFQNDRLQYQLTWNYILITTDQNIHFLLVANFYFLYYQIWTSVKMDGKLKTDHMPQMK